MGKPFGFGCMKLHIDSLLETDVQSLYSVDGLCSAPGDDRTELVDHYIEAYDRFAAENLKIKEPKKCPSVRSRNEILDFLYLLYFRTGISPHKIPSKPVSTPLEGAMI